MKKISFKKAFTMVEVITVMIVIGIILGITMQVTANKVEKADRYTYYAAYMTLKQLAAEMVAENVDMSSLGGGALCTQMEKRLNLLKQQLKIGSSYVTPACTVAHSITNSTDFATLTPNLVLRNGMRFYNLSSAKVSISQLAGASTTNSNGYIIDADINAERGAGVLYQDVYPFYLTVSGMVVPAYPAAGTAGGNDPDDIMFSVRYDQITNSSTGATRIERWLVKSVSYQEAACKSGYQTSSTYCSSYSVDATCSAAGANCVLVPVPPIRYMVK